jgi:hypothetical protein
MSSAPEVTFREFDNSQQKQDVPTSVPYVVIGTSNKGPAFVPITVANFDTQFKQYFGGVDPNKPGTYAARSVLQHRNSLTYVRVLGAGANTTDADVSATVQTGCVKNAGMKLAPSPAPGDSLGRSVGAVQFITARHTPNVNASFSVPMFSQNDSVSSQANVNLVRGVVFLASGSRLMTLDGNASAVNAFTGTGPIDVANISSGTFKLAVSSSLGSSFWTADGNAGVKIFSASLDPSSANYIGKILNTNPDRFVQEQHYLYADFPVDDQVATVTMAGVVSGSANKTSTGGDSTSTYLSLFGRYDSRYQQPKTSMFISQPYGVVEFDLFRVESLDDGSYANNLYKISIADITVSNDPSNDYGTFTLLVRDWNDTDANPSVIEQFSQCSLDPKSPNYIVALVGDRRVSFNFDSSAKSERRQFATGLYPNKSKYIRLVPSDALKNGLVPSDALPFGFRGAQLLKTNDSLTDTAGTNARLAGALGTSVGSSLSGSIMPPVPFRTKVTRGDEPTSITWIGQPSATEETSALLYWGVKFEKNDNIVNPNVSSDKNDLLEAYTKFYGAEKLDTVLSGSALDTLNNDKFSLSKVAFSNALINELTSSVSTHMREAAYVRNAKLDTATYQYTDAVIGKRATFATLLALGKPSDFNRFNQYAKFTTFMQGGWDGTNILDKDSRLLNDRSTSLDVGGQAESTYISKGLLVNATGTGQSNSSIASYLTALDIVFDPTSFMFNVIGIPGIRESYVTDYAARLAQNTYKLAFLVIDIPSYDDSSSRIFEDSTTRPNVSNTASAVDARAIDNNYVASYFPDASIDDATSNRRVYLPASTFALEAYAYNDKVGQPWYVPAGFNRGSLFEVKSTKVRLNATDRSRLDSSNINDIATFPKSKFVIYSQKTMQAKTSSLTQISVKRCVLECKRIVSLEARGLMFENDDDFSESQKFVSNCSRKISYIAANSGLQKFKVTMDATNNTQEDTQLKKRNGYIDLTPVNSADSIHIDFVITNSDVVFSN